MNGPIGILAAILVVASTSSARSADASFLKNEAVFAARFCLAALTVDDIDTAPLVKNGYKKVSNRVFKKRVGETRLKFEVRDYKKRRKNGDNCAIEIEMWDVNQIIREMRPKERAAIDAYHDVWKQAGFQAERRKKPGSSARSYLVGPEFETSFRGIVDVGSITRTLRVSVTRKNP